MAMQDIFAANHPLAQGDGSRESKLVIPSSTPIEGASLDSVMEAVPAVFFQDNFDLSDPECFATAVCFSARGCVYLCSFAQWILSSGMCIRIIFVEGRRR